MELMNLPGRENRIEFVGGLGVVRNENRWWGADLGGDRGRECRER